MTHTDRQLRRIPQREGGRGVGMRGNAVVENAANAEHGAVRVVGLGAICDLDRNGINSPRENSFRVSEFVLLDNGESVILHADRGYCGTSSSGSIWAHETIETITHNVLNTVLPDDDETEDEHPWEWLAELAQAQEIDVTADALRQVPYEVVLTERVVQRLSATASPPFDGT